jgi:hypothetical protein
VPGVLPAERLDVRFELGRGKEDRLIALEPRGEDLRARLGGLLTGIIQERFR